MQLMDMKQEHKAAFDRAEVIITKAEHENRPLTTSEKAEYGENMAKSNP
ncbi:hypothetical protein [Terriglobus albidus]|nr:hypothetical protein [Terriglobus albidus]